jgi:hypothetical protein
MTKQKDSATIPPSVPLLYECDERAAQISKFCIHVNRVLFSLAPDT